MQALRQNACLQYGYDFLSKVQTKKSVKDLYADKDSYQVFYLMKFVRTHSCDVGKKSRATSRREDSLPILALKETAVFCHEALPCEQQRSAA